MIQKIIESYFVAVVMTVTQIHLMESELWHSSRQTWHFFQQKFQVTCVQLYLDLNDSHQLHNVHLDQLTFKVAMKLLLLKVLQWGMSTMIKNLID